MLDFLERYDLILYATESSQLLIIEPNVWIID